MFERVDAHKQAPLTGTCVQLIQSWIAYDTMQGVSPSGRQPHRDPLVVVYLNEIDDAVHMITRGLPARDPPFGVEEISLQERTNDRAVGETTCLDIDPVLAHNKGRLGSREVLDQSQRQYELFRLLEQCRPHGIASRLSAIHPTSVHEFHCRWDCQRAIVPIERQDMRGPDLRSNGNPSSTIEACVQTSMRRHILDADVSALALHDAQCVSGGAERLPE
mmetsp:Transcript_63062/g.177855  ORF Transcript_63062/g.177855 Transcript_63062/m.177855 type:complete len:219 (+) Transcript_63062:361-1017(+)